MFFNAAIIVQTTETISHPTSSEDIITSYDKWLPRVSRKTLCDEHDQTHANQTKISLKEDRVPCQEDAAPADDKETNSISCQTTCSDLQASQQDLLPE